MWRISVVTVVYIYLAFSPDVQVSIPEGERCSNLYDYTTSQPLRELSPPTGMPAGSCLEYGHSCWGAHGKRSSVAAIGGKKAPRGSASRNLLDSQLNVLGEDNGNSIAANKFDSEEVLTSAETSPHRTVSAEEFSADSNDSTKSRSLPRQRHLQFLPHISQGDSNKPMPFDGTNRKDNAYSREELPQQQQQQRKYSQHVERWPKLPIFGLRHRFGNSPMALTDAAPLELPSRNTENDLFQQIGQLAGDGRLADIGVYYDFP